METEVRVSKPPIFDFDKAILAKETTDKEGFRDRPNVRCAGNLWLYNTPINGWSRVLRKLQILKSQEIEAALPGNPLPTIGWEVESPRKPFQQYLAPRYALFFDLMGLPRNRNHSNLEPGNNPGSYPNVWEFSTAPAYSSALVNRTLCELIKGGFIPHLEGSDITPQQRRDLLDDKLVSLHVNLGIPDWLESRNPKIDNPDIMFLASSFELAYTSSERLAHRSQTIVVNHKVAATFSSISESDPSLSGIWNSTRDSIRRIYRNYNVESGIVTSHEASAALVEKCDIQKELRYVLTEGAHNVRIYLATANFT